MKNVKKLIVVLVMALVFTGLYIPQSSPAYASASSDVTKMLNAYKKHHYATANKYAKKLKSTRDASERKMTSSMKKAFKKVSRRFTPTYFCEIYFVDMDGDNKAEMLVVDGNGLAFLTAYVYKYKSGKAVYVDQFLCGHADLVNYPGHTGVIYRFGHMAYEEIYTVRLKNGKIKSTYYGGRNLGLDNFLNLKPLYNHKKSDRWNLGF